MGTGPFLLLNDFSPRPLDPLLAETFLRFSITDAGIPLALKSDRPLNPDHNIIVASVHPRHPEEASTREQAVEA